MHHATPMPPSDPLLAPWVLELSVDVSSRLASFYIVAHALQNRETESKHRLNVVGAMFVPLECDPATPVAEFPATTVTMQLKAIVRDWEGRIVLAQCDLVDPNTDALRGPDGDRRHFLVVAMAPGVHSRDVKGVARMALTTRCVSTIDYDWWDVAGFNLQVTLTVKRREW